jgi:hypothetical protein
LDGLPPSWVKRIRLGLGWFVWHLTGFKKSKVSKDKKFFFEKNNQKTFAPHRAVSRAPGSKTNKSDLLF